MQMPKPSQVDKDRFGALVPDRPDVEVKPMFGNLGVFVNGNMFAGLFGASVGVKLAEADRAELGSVEAAAPFGPSERPMGGYLALPPAFVEDPALGAPWVERALEHVSSLPPKVRKPPRGTAARKAGTP
jgi:TfoX/Sxy family transcriptional regulator of competence genes